MANLMSQKMGIHEWSYGNDITDAARNKVPWAPPSLTLNNIKVPFLVQDGYGPCRPVSLPPGLL